LGLKGDNAKALELEFRALHLSEKLNDPVQISLSFFWIGLVYLYSGDTQQALYYFDKLRPASEAFLKNQELILTHIGWCYFESGRLDSALFYIKKAYDIESSRR
jgi:tetratricopeptide (TPR) repeat protein